MSRNQNDPYERLVRLLLETAIGMSAKAVVFGVPWGVEWDVDEAKRMHDQGLLAFVHERASSLTAKDLASVRQDSTLRYRNGFGQIPIWFEAEGEFRPAMPISGGGYGPLLAKFQALLVPLEGEGRQPPRLIEISAEPGTGRRRFAEVELIMAQDNTVRVEIVGVRTSPQRPSIMAGIIARLLAIAVAAFGAGMIWSMASMAVDLVRSGKLTREPGTALFIGFISLQMLAFSIFCVWAAVAAWKLRSEVAVRWVCGAVAAIGWLFAWMAIARLLPRFALADHPAFGMEFGLALVLALLAMLCHGLLSRWLLTRLALTTPQALARRPLVSRTALRWGCLFAFVLIAKLLLDSPYKAQWAQAYGVLVAAATALTLYGILAWLTGPAGKPTGFTGGSHGAR